MEVPSRVKSPFDTSFCRVPLGRREHRTERQVISGSLAPPRGWGQRQDVRGCRYLGDSAISFTSRHQEYTIGRHSVSCRVGAPYAASVSATVGRGQRTHSRVHAYSHTPHTHTHTHTHARTHARSHARTHARARKNQSQGLSPSQAPSTYDPRSKTFSCRNEEVVELAVAPTTAKRTCYEMTCGSCADPHLKR